MHLNPDHYLQTESGRQFSMERNAAAWEQLYLDLSDALRTAPRKVVMVLGIQGSGKSTWVSKRLSASDQTIYVDATFATALRRARVIGIAQASGVPVAAVWIRVSLETALRRNAGRSPDEIVPEDAVANVFKLFEPPSVVEGFSEIHILDEQFNVVQEDTD